MYYLREKDYNLQIRPTNLDQVAYDNESRRTSELLAIAELTSFLSNRYQVAEIFKPINTFSLSAFYVWGDRVEWTGMAYNALTVYTNLDLVLYNGIVYLRNATTSGYVAGTLPTNATYFEPKGVEGLYFITPPPTWNYDLVYTYNEKVSFKGYYYSKNIITTGYTFGIEPTNTAYFTKINASSNPVTGEYPNNTNFWTFGDNRNEQVKAYCIDIALYHLHSNINPRNIPQLRIDRYNNAINWCKMVNSGDIMADLPQLQQKTGFSIISGGNPKLNHLF